MLTLVVVGIFGTLVFLYASGYRLNPKTLKVSESGLLVIKSYPDGAQVFINGDLKTATNATLSLPPRTYEVSIRKEGYLEWKKRLELKKGEVTEATAHLFKTAPSLSAITFTSVSDALLSPDLTKIAYVVPPNGNPENEGLWILETIDLPLGFAREPRRVTDGNLVNARFFWSPDGRQILMQTPKGAYVLDTLNFTSQKNLTNIASEVKQILSSWEEEKEKGINSKLKKLPDRLQDILTRKTSAISFSPDEDMVLYTASASANIPEKLIKSLPGASTQKEEREIKEGRTYIYDIKEDRNFFITEGEVKLNGWIEYNKAQDPNSQISNPKRSLSWYPSSRHVILAEEGKITIMDYDGTNRQVVYSGSYIAPHAYPSLSLNKLLILTNLGAAEKTLIKLYSLNIK